MAGALLLGDRGCAAAGPSSKLGVEQGITTRSSGRRPRLLQTPVFANSVQEMCDLTIHAFDVADRYAPVMVLADRALGQMMEPVTITTSAAPGRKAVAVTGTAQTRQNLITSILLEHEKQEMHITGLERTYAEIEKRKSGGRRSGRRTPKSSSSPSASAAALPAPQWPWPAPAVGGPAAKSASSLSPPGGCASWRARSIILVLELTTARWWMMSCTSPAPPSS